MTEGASTSFELLPAIDLRDGRVVRLRQGSFDREQVYADDPAPVAAGFRAVGARWIHVVDLDGARTGTRAHDAATAEIVAAATSGTDRPPMHVQVAGGLRDRAAVAAALAAGAARVVLGTAALQDVGLVARLVARHGADRIAAALDIRDGLAVGDGWVPGAAGLPVDEALRTLRAAGITTFVMTAIARDGLLGGPDLDLLARLVDAGDHDVIASGGIASIDDLVAVRDLGCRGAIVGRALYDGRIDLADALTAVSATGRPAGPSTSR
jgi:phosphoribosylformimino-5-aminoimidazole carboxamide ribotide isomerase